MKSQKISCPIAPSFVDSKVKKYFYCEKNEKDLNTPEQSPTGRKKDESTLIIETFFFLHSWTTK
jgi:hypothetical protein